MTTDSPWFIRDAVPPVSTDAGRPAPAGGDFFGQLKGMLKKLGVRGGPSAPRESLQVLRDQEERLKDLHKRK